MTEAEAREIYSLVCTCTAAARRWARGEASGAECDETLMAVNRLLIKITIKDEVTRIKEIA